MARYKVDNLDDLFQVGCLGLVKAIDNFDMSYNVTLSTYACQWHSAGLKDVEFYYKTLIYKDSHKNNINKIFEKF